MKTPLLKLPYPTKNGREYNLTGLKLGKLTIIKKIRMGKYNHWECKCECGKTCFPMTGTITCGDARSCGCQRKETLAKKRLPKGEVGFRYALSLYKRNARLRNLEWNLSNEEAKTLFQGDCYYCGDKNSNLFVPPKSSGYSESGTIYTQYSYNGIDRLNSSIGYTINNCVSCCRTCNFGKQDLNYSDFLLWIRKVNNFTLNRSLINVSEGS